MFEKASAEMNTNYLAPKRLTELLLPVLSQQPTAAIINVTSIVAYVPVAGAPTYSASKVAVHAYTQALRHTLKPTNIRVVELLLSQPATSTRPRRPWRFALLVLIANGDRIVPNPNSYYMDRRFPNAELLIYKKFGHGSVFQEHAQYVPKVLNFLAN